MTVFPRNSKLFEYLVQERDPVGAVNVVVLMHIFR